MFLPKWSDVSREVTSLARVSVCPAADTAADGASERTEEAVVSGTDEPDCTASNSGLVGLRCYPSSTGSQETIWRR